MKYRPGGRQMKPPVQAAPRSAFLPRAGRAPDLLLVVLSAARPRRPGRARAVHLCSRASSGSSSGRGDTAGTQMTAGSSFAPAPLSPCPGLHPAYSTLEGARWSSHQWLCPPRRCTPGTAAAVAAAGWSGSSRRRRNGKRQDAAMAPVTFGTRGTMGDDDGARSVGARISSRVVAR